MPAPTISTLPDAPLRSEAPATFTSKAEAWVDAIAAWTTEVNAFGSYLDGLGIEGSGSKLPVRVATTANGTLATAFANGQTVDGVTLATGDRILLKDQSAGAENGIYVVAASGAPARASDMDAASEVAGAGIYVIAGTTNGGTLWFNTNTSTPTLGTTALTFAQFTGGGASLSGTNTWTGKQAFSAGATVTPAATPATTEIGYLGSPQMSDQDDYTLAMGDAGKHYYHVSATPHTLTIPANSSVAFPIGTVIAIVNENGAGAITLAITSDTLRWGSSTGSRTIAADGTATLIKVTSTVWRLTGDGIT